MIHNDLLTADEASPIVHLHPVTLCRWRLAGKGPTYIKIGRKIFYERGALLDWLARQRHGATT